MSIKLSSERVEYRIAIAKGREVAHHVRSVMDMGMQMESKARRQRISNNSIYEGYNDQNSP